MPPIVHYYRLRTTVTLLCLSLSLIVSAIARASVQPTQGVAQPPVLTPDKTEPERLVHRECSRLAGKLGSVNLSDCINARLWPSTGLSVLQAPIMIREFPPLPHRKPQARILMLGGLHGDEYASVSIIFKWLKTLNRHHSGLFHWRIVPLGNPDGLLRKESQRVNQNGVDLNRNFPTPEWESKSRHYWNVKTGRNPRRYPGPAAASEPETRWLVEEIDTFKPDVIVSVHAPFGVLDFDAIAYESSPPERLGSLYLNMLGTYPGSLGNYAGVQKSIPVVTIELASAGIMPSPTEISRIWTDLVAWLKDNVNNPKAHKSSDVLPTDQAGPS